MGYFQEKVVAYKCRCDTCGLVAPVQRTSRVGDEWNETKWRKLYRALRKLGWKPKKTGTAGHAHNPVFDWTCPGCQKRKAV